MVFKISQEAPEIMQDCWLLMITVSAKVSICVLATAQFLLCLARNYRNLTIFCICSAFYLVFENSIHIYNDPEQLMLTMWEFSVGPHARPTTYQRSYPQRKVTFSAAANHRLFSLFFIALGARDLKSR